MTTKTVGFTPGPWTLGRFGCVTGGAWLQYVNGQAQAQIASATVGDGIEPEEREANARLIAAAPELLTELEFALRDVKCRLDMLPLSLSDPGMSEQETILHAQIRRYEAAIRKARGE